MSKGEEYARKLDDILKLMYDRGAIGGQETMSREDIATEVELDSGQVLHLMQLLRDEAKVDMPASGVYRLTGRGFREARGLSQSEKGK